MKAALGIGLIAVAACTGNTETAWLEPPNDDALVIAAPEPVLDQDGFVQTFTDLCLSSPATLSQFQAVADRYGLVQTPGKNPSHRSFAWQKPFDGQDTALGISVGTRPVLYSVTSNDSSISGLPIRSRNCSVTAHLKGSVDQNFLKGAVRSVLIPKAKVLDYSAYSKDYRVRPEDVQVSLVPANYRSFTDLRSGSECPKDAPCWKVSPHILSLAVVVERIP